MVKGRDGMLVLSRCIDERIAFVLEDERVIEVTLVDIRGLKARLGIKAPRTIDVDRWEIYQQKLALPPHCIPGRQFAQAEIEATRVIDLSNFSASDYPHAVAAGR